MSMSCQSRNEFSSGNLDSNNKGTIDRNESLIEEQQVYDDSIYRIPDIQASFHGGDYARVKFFEENLKFPTTKLTNDDRNVVFLNFVVEPDSTCSNIKIVRGINDDFNNEAIRVVELAKWNPGKKNGKIVRSEFTFPVMFKKNE
jgi:protein TonB